MGRVRLHLLFGLPNPLGLTALEADAVCEQLTAPLLWAVGERESLKLSLHAGGHLLERLEAAHPAVANQLASLVSAGHVEPIGGGFFEPDLGMLLWRDAMGQLEMSAGFWERRTGRRPRGAWTGHRPWFPRLAEILSDAGISWTCARAEDLRLAGAPTPDSGWYVTEHVARPLALFASQDVGPRVGGAPPSQAIEALRDVAQISNEPEHAVTWMVQWPLSHWAEELEWWCAFFDAAERESGWLQLAHPSDTLTERSSSGRVYLDVGSSLRPPAMGGPHATSSSGSSRAVLAQYAEADRLHKRMIEVSRRFAAAERVMRNGGYRAMSQLTRPRRMLYRGQCATIYDVKGARGLFDPAVRAETYHQLLLAEACCDRLMSDLETTHGVEVSLRDVYADMTTAVVLRNQALRVVIRPRSGGGVWALEDLRRGWALHDVLGPTRVEADPDEARAEGGLFLDRLHSTCGDDDVDSPSEAVNLSAHDYRLVAVDEDMGGASVALATEAHVTHDGEDVHVGILKEYWLAELEGEVRCHWTLDVDGPLRQPMELSVEVNLSTLGVAGAPRCDVTGQPDHAEESCRVSVDWRERGLLLSLVGQGGQWRVQTHEIVTVTPAQNTTQGLQLTLTCRLPAAVQTMECALLLRVEELTS